MHEKSEDQQNPRNIEIIHDAFFYILTWVTKSARANWAERDGNSRMKELGFGKLEKKNWGFRVSKRERERERER